MTWLFFFILGLWVGSFGTAVILSMLALAKEADERTTRENNVYRLRGNG